MTNFYAVSVTYGSVEKVDAIVDLEQVIAVAAMAAGLVFKFRDGTMLSVNMGIEAARAQILEIHELL